MKHMIIEDKRDEGVEKTHGIVANNQSVAVLATKFSHNLLSIFMNKSSTQDKTRPKTSAIYP